MLNLERTNSVYRRSLIDQMLSYHKIPGNQRLSEFHQFLCKYHLNVFAKLCCFGHLCIVLRHNQKKVHRADYFAWYLMEVYLFIWRIMNNLHTLPRNIKQNCWIVSALWSFHMTLCIYREFETMFHCFTISFSSLPTMVVYRVTTTTK